MIDDFFTQSLSKVIDEGSQWKSYTDLTSLTDNSLEEIMN